ncbi:MAG: serine/threonine protein kinase [Gemmatimonadaceae bacterium]|nr:serine/threonine protein kinase [Gemmatimonadaceae bacterium]
MSETEGGSLEVVSGRYALERELGRGGSAVVYLARDLRDDRTVALKVLHQEFSGSRSAERFGQEIRLLQEFDHPGILTVTDAGEWQGRPFYVMPYVDGESLQGRLRRERRLPLSEAVRIGQRLCEALAYAHGRKVVHRDVKPANVMLSGEAVYLTDFGIAKALEPVGEAPHSTTGVARGTRAYMSPEQATADRDLDHRSDIFSLGCVLYEMIAGQNPYHSADEARTLLRRLTDAPDPLGRHRDGVPAGLEGVVMKALAREPADRWQGVGERGEGVGGGGWADSSFQLRRKEGKRNAWIASLAGATGVIVIWNAWTIGSMSACVLPTLDAVRTPRAVVFPPQSVSSDSMDASAGVGESMRDAVMRWRDVSVVEAVASDAWGDRQSAECTVRKNGGHFLVAGRLLPTGSIDSLRLEVRVVGANVDSRSTTVTNREQVTDPAFWTMLIRESFGPPVSSTGYPETDSIATSFAAWRECRDGWSALASGLADSAVTRFRRAAESDPAYGCPQLGLVIGIQLQRREAPEEWRSLANKALSSGTGWTRSEGAILSAAVARADSRFDDACPILAKVAESRPTDFLLLTLLSDCMASDSTLVRVRDGSLVFRSSWMEARRVLLRALDQSPEDFNQLVIPRLSQVSPTAPTVRWGWVTGDGSARYGAYPAWTGDSISLVPRDREQITRSESRAVPTTLGAALLEGKRLQVEVAGRWVNRAPTSGAALFAHARALELIGRLLDSDSSAVTALHELERASSAPEDRVAALPLLEARTRMLLKAGRLAELSRVVDSALARSASVDQETARVLGPLALLTGRLGAGVTMLQHVLAKDLTLPVSDAVRHQLATFSAYSSVGCCAKQLDSLHASLTQRLAAELDQRTQREWEERLLARWVSLAAPCRGWSTVLSLADSTDVIVRIQRAVARRQFAFARRELRRLKDDRRRFGAGDIAVDYVVQETHASLAMGDTVVAREQMEAWLAALPVSGALELREISQAAAIQRLLRLADFVGVRLPTTWGAFADPGAALEALLTHQEPQLSRHAFPARSASMGCLQQPSSSAEE